MLEKLDDITALGEKVIRILGQNGSPFTLQGTNCYLVGTGSKRILIDTGSGLKSFQTILQKAMEENHIKAIETIIITHHHIDHIGGVKSILKMTNEDDKIVGVVVYMKDIGPVWREHKRNLQYCSLHDGQLIKTEGATLEVWMSPGHTSDSICLWMPEERALFSGDSILGEGKSPVLEDLNSYFTSMHSLLARIESYTQPVTIYPGHGQVIKDGAAAIRLAISKREARNEEIMRHLKTNPWVSVEQITNEVYKKVPPELRIAAVGTVKRHLAYLEQTGQVTKRKNEENIGIYALKT